MHLYTRLISAIFVGCGGCSPLPEARNGIDMSTVMARQSLPITSNTPLVKGLATSIAGAVFLCTAATYILVIKYGPWLSQGLVLPLSSLERNLSTFLSRFWIDSALSSCTAKHKFRALRITAKEGQYDVYSFVTAGHGEFRHHPLPATQQRRYERCVRDGQVWFNPASPVMKHIIQIAIWEFWTLWMVIAMVSLTVVYNGFIYGQPGPDGVLRLVLVGAYAVANLFHVLWSWRYLSRILRAVETQACWVIISKICAFFSADLSCRGPAAANSPWLDNATYLNLRRVQCDLLGPTKLIDTMEGEPDLPDYPKTHLTFEPDREQIKSVAENDIKPMLETEVKAFEKAGESCLDRVLANVVVVLGTCLSSGVAPWTTVQSQDSTATQLGSYAIILAIGTGATALIGSVNHLSNAAECAETLQRFQAHMLSLSNEQHLVRLSARAARYGSAMSESMTAGRQATTWSDVWKCTSPRLMPCLPVWGPALGLLPRSRKGAKPEPSAGSEGGDESGGSAPRPVPDPDEAATASRIDEMDPDYTGAVRFQIASTVFQFDIATDELYVVKREEASADERESSVIPDGVEADNRNTGGQNEAGGERSETKSKAPQQESAAEDGKLA
jgi:hypothetical protein